MADRNRNAQIDGEILTQKYGIDMKAMFKGQNIKLSNDVAEGLITSQTSPFAKKTQNDKDFKFYNNSYLYVTFRKEYLERLTTNKLAVNLLKSTRQDI